MNNFVAQSQEEGTNTKRSRLAKQLQNIERSEDEKQTPEKFNFMLDVAENIADSRAALRAYHWLKHCTSMNRTPKGILLNYSDKNSAVWALNFIREGIVPKLKTSNLFTSYNGEILGYITPPNRKTGKIDALASVCKTDKNALK